MLVTLVSIEVAISNIQSFHGDKGSAGRILDEISSLESEAVGGFPWTVYSPCIAASLVVGVTLAYYQYFSQYKLTALIL